LEECFTPLKEGASDTMTTPPTAINITPTAAPAGVTPVRTKAGGGEVELELETLKLATEGSLANLATELGEIQTKLALLHAQVTRGQQAERQAQHQLAFHQERLRAIAGYTKAQELCTTLGQEAATYRAQIAELTERQKLITERLNQLASETLMDIEPPLGTNGATPAPVSPTPTPAPGKVASEGISMGVGNDDGASFITPAAVEALPASGSEPAAAPPVPPAPEVVVTAVLAPAPELAPAPPPAPAYYSANHFWAVALSDLVDSQAEAAIQTRLNQVSEALSAGNLLEASDLISRAAKGAGRRSVAVWLATAALTSDLEEAGWCLEQALSLLASGLRTQKTEELEARINAALANQASALPPKPAPQQVGSAQATLVSAGSSIATNPEEILSPIAEVEVKSGSGAGAVTTITAIQPAIDAEELATSFYFEDYGSQTASSELEQLQTGAGQLLTETEEAQERLPRPFGVRGNQ
jgi:hypothetical protein